MAVTMGTTLSALIKAGVGVHATMTANATSQVDNFMNQAEAFLCNLVEYDLITNWASLNVVYKLMFVEYVERSAAIECIFYGTAGYSNGLIEAEDLITVHLYRIQRIETLLKDADVQDFLGV